MKRMHQEECGNHYDMTPLHMFKVATPVKNIKTNIIIEYGIPSETVSDNRSKFTSNRIPQFCEEHLIKLAMSTACYSQSNGLAGRIT
ncbi:hypothetical protein OSB04_002630 [Centaurea solstitialis]|uniref:Integrase catalytic domain-containing protein n=1 Tax=Centaurea solstitialis TaxID=347529 RepID=A0AA38TV51_9ASTR|nr:hypothetical protein OSB04_002630 [Centaurea solstitialis]